ncbi:Hypothetical predicted protein [Mytilus galloprovincialis]|uniref:Peptidase M12B domain-containing protein n=1 Tax=Mytilus galloprovincialis TaxID=29158 RepID=A0A8B6F096_MYTGA|nr:Hypothetical predicted protein [Mytilus galloprovincialis]
MNVGECIFLLSISYVCSLQLHTSVPILKRDPVQIEVSSFSSNHERHKRHTNLPDKMHIIIRNDHFHQSFEVEKHDNIDQNFPLYTNGHLYNNYSKPKVPTHFYQCVTKECLFQAEKLIRLNSTAVIETYLLFGTFHIDGQLHILQSSSNGDHSIIVPEVQVFDWNIPISENKVPHNNANRKKRATGNYQIELLMVVDYSAYQFWLSEKNNNVNAALEAIRQFYAYMIKGIDLRYKNIPGVSFTMDIKTAGLYILQDAASAQFTENNTDCQASSRCTLDSGTTLAAFQNWIQTQGSGIPAHDHAMLFTRHDITLLDSSNATGYAYLGAMCTDQSVSIVEEDFNFISQTIAAHELAHSLSAVHDELDNTCLSARHNIMAAVSQAISGSTSTNPWKFSSCSGQEINTRINTIESSGNNCLSTTISSNHNILDSYLTKPIGQSYTADQQCKMAFGVSSFVCRLPYVNAGSFQTACTGLWCVNPKLANQCSLILPAERTSCGNGKWCEGYHCVTSSNAPALTENCVFGDQTGVIVLGHTCASLILQQAYRCYNPTIYPQCCKSCNNIATGVTGCEFGDKIDCSAITSYGCYANGENCCNTCSPYITNIPDCKYGDRSDCSGIKGGYQCYGDNGITCCQTCTQFKSTIADCEFGDRAHNCDINVCPTYSETDRNLCCYTCNGINPASPSSRPNNPETTTSSSTASRPNNPETTTSSSTALPAWVLPVAISAGCLLLLILIIVIVCCIRMSRRSHRKPSKAPLKNVVSHDKIRYQNDNTLQGGPRKHKTELRKHSPNGEMRPPPVKRQVSHGAIKTQSSTRPISKDIFPSQDNRRYSRPPTGRQGSKSNHLSPQRSKRDDQYYSNRY